MIAVSQKKKKPRRTSFRWDWECGQLEYNGSKHFLKEHANLTIVTSIKETFIESANTITYLITMLF